MSRSIPPVNWARYASGVALQLVVMGILLLSLWNAFHLSASVAGGVGAVVALNVIYRVVAFRDRRRTLEAAPLSMSLTERAAAVRAVRGGPVPEDPHVRAEALRLARYELAQSDRSPAGMITMGVVSLGCIVAAFVVSPWLWLTTACFVTVLLLTFVRRRQIERRWQLLRDIGTDLRG